MEDVLRRVHSCVQEIGGIFSKQVDNVKKFLELNFHLPFRYFIKEKTNGSDIFASPSVHNHNTAAILKHFSFILSFHILSFHSLYPRFFLLTPKAEKRLVLRWSLADGWWSRTSDLGLGGFRGLMMTFCSSRISSSRSLLSDDTDSWRWTRSWPATPPHSATRIEISKTNFQRNSADIKTILL